MSPQAAGNPETALVTALFERYHVEVFRYLCHMVHDRQWAEDLMQETFLRAFDVSGRLSQVSNRRAWLYRVANNLALDGLRRRRRFAWLPLRAADTREGEAPAEPLGKREALEAALLALAPARWQARGQLLELEWRPDGAPQLRGPGRVHDLRASRRGAG